MSPPSVGTLRSYHLCWPRSKETIAKFKFMHNYFYEHNSYATFTYCQLRGWRCLAYFSHPHLFLLPASANKSKKKLILTWPAAITLVRVCLLLSVTCPSSNTLAKALTSQLKLERITEILHGGRDNREFLMNPLMVTKVAWGLSVQIEEMFANSLTW